MSAAAQVNWDSSPTAKVQWDDENLLVTGKGMEANAQRQAHQVPVQAMRHAHGAVSLMGRPASSQAADEAFDDALHAPNAPKMPLYLSGPKPVVPMGMQDVAHIAESVPAVAQSLAAFPAAGAAPGKFIRAVAGGIAGSQTGKYGAEAFGASPEVEQFASDLGGIAGGAAGSALDNNTVAQALGEPYSGSLKPFLRFPLVKSILNPVIPRGDAGTITNPVTVMRQDVPLVPEGTYYRTSSVQQAQEPFAPQGPTRVNPLDIDKSNLPDYYAPQGPTRINSVSGTNASSIRRQSAPDVMVVPEPRPLAPGEKPGSMYSVPRAKLRSMAQTGKPGAVDVLRDLGQPSIVLPREGIGYPGPRTMNYLTPEELEDIYRPRFYRNAAD